MLHIGKRVGNKGVYNGITCKNMEEVGRFHGHL